jgi:hypothetical protein
VTDAVVPPRPRGARIALRVAFVAGVLVASSLLIVSLLDDLDAGEILGALGGLGDAEVLALGGMWLLWLAAQGLQTAALVPDLPVRRGVMAFLGPAAVAFVIPGPSDLPVRHRMLTSWGMRSADAALAVTAAGVFSIGIKLALPVVAAAGVLASGAPLDSTLRALALVAGAVALVVLALGALLRSEGRTERVSHLLAPLWHATARLLRRPEKPDLVSRLVRARAKAVDTLRGRWLLAAWGALLAAAVRFALLLMALRFTGVPASAIGWAAAFAVFALVQGITVLPVTPGDAGVSELAYIGLLSAAADGAYVNEITAAVLVFRLLTWFAVIPAGMTALALWRRRLAGGAATAATR